MARKLPWTISTTSNTTSTIPRSTSDSRPTKRAKRGSKTERETSKEAVAPQSSRLTHQDSSSAVLGRARNHAKGRRDVRSPSTSPPPAPPPQSTELMRPGFDEDDIYMLVEDEFQALAQSYTAHLHHAEYKRLMRLAKEKKAAAGTTLDSREIRGEMSSETKQKLKVAKLRERQSSGLKSLMGAGLADDDDEEDQDIEEGAREAVLAREEKKVGNMWAGTPLSGLMEFDHSQERTSLKGLDKIRGETRASKGFGPSIKKESSQSREVIELGGKEDEMTTKGTEKPKISSRGAQVHKDTTRSSGLNGARKYLQKSEEGTIDTASKKKHSPTIKSESSSDTKNEIARPKQQPKSRTGATTSKYRSFIDSLDDFDEVAFDATQADDGKHSDQLRSRQLTMKQKEKQKKDRRDRLDEVPAFVI